MPLKDKVWAVLTELREEGERWSAASLADILEARTSTKWSEADVKRLVPKANKAHHIKGIAPLRARRHR